MTSFLAVFALTVTSPAAPPPSGVNAAPSAAYAPAPAAPAPSARPVVSVVVETAKPAKHVPSQEVVDPFNRPQPRGALPEADADLLDPFAAGNLAVRQEPSEPLFESGELRDPFGR